MPYVTLQASSLTPDVKPVEIYYRDEGEGPPLIVLHGGWGYEIYPFDQQIAALKSFHRIIIPDRSRYGKSSRFGGELPTDFHYRAASETLALLDELKIDRAVFWGHSDGAVIAAILGFTSPTRVEALILEGFHLYGYKPSSKDFFEWAAFEWTSLPGNLPETLAREHGEHYWQELISSHAKSWLRLGEQCQTTQQDLYEGRLREIAAPTLIIHGRWDPRTEDGELDMIRLRLPKAEIHVLEEGMHSPHSEAPTAEKSTQLAHHFLRQFRNKEIFSQG